MAGKLDRTLAESQSQSVMKICAQMVAGYMLLKMGDFFEAPKSIQSTAERMAALASELTVEMLDVGRFGIGDTDTTITARSGVAILKDRAKLLYDICDEIEKFHEHGATT